MPFLSINFRILPSVFASSSYKVISVRRRWTFCLQEFSLLDAVMQLDRLRFAPCMIQESNADVAWLASTCLSSVSCVITGLHLLTLEWTLNCLNVSNSRASKLSVFVTSYIALSKYIE